MSKKEIIIEKDYNKKIENALVFERMLEMKDNITIFINMFKGGVGKSTLVQIATYFFEYYAQILDQINEGKNTKKLLVIDFEPQRNLTRKIFKNFPPEEKAKTPLFKGIENSDLSNSITKLTDHIDIIEGDWDISKLDKYANANIRLKAHDYILSYLLKPLKEQYDLILIDSIPTTSIWTNNCSIVSDFVFVPVTTDDECFTNFSDYINYLTDMSDYNPNLDIIGALPYLSEENNSTNIKYLNKYRETYKDLIFENIIKKSDRVLSWGGEGISTNKGWDKINLKMYEKAIQELCVRTTNLLKGEEENE